MKRTPGPWKRFGLQVRTIDDCLPIAALAVTGDQGAKNYEEAHANGDLLATAPDMLGLLRELVKSPDTFGAQHWITRARLTIARAEGEIG